MSPQDGCPPPTCKKSWPHTIPLTGFQEQCTLSNPSVRNRNKVSGPFHFYTQKFQYSDTLHSYFQSFFGKNLILWTLYLMMLETWGEILRPPENSASQAIVFRNKEIGDKLCGKHWNKVMFLSKYSLDRNYTIASLFLWYTIYPRFLDIGVLFSGWLRISPLQ
jgi:hypothetical protein